MKIKLALMTMAVIGLAPGLGAQTVTVSQTYGVPVVIPNNNILGVAETLNFSSALTSISDVEVSLDIAPGGYDGDYYAYLSYGTGFAVLLNRVGSTTANPSGSPDSGFNVTFSGSAANGDIHLENAGGGLVTGTWQPDGRNVSPLIALDTDPRTALLSSFDGLNPNGAWDLFIADVTVGGQGSLVSWGVTVTESATVVSDTGSTMGLLVLGTGFLGLCSLRERRLAGPGYMDGHK